MMIIFMYIIAMTPTLRRVQTVGYLLWHLSIKWRVAVDRALNRFGLTHAHYLLLGSLYEFSRSGAKPSQRELADFAGLEVVYVSKLARTLERCGLLQRADHRSDPRAFQLELTARGADLVVQAAAVMRELYDQLLRPIGGRTGKRHAALMQTLETLLDEAEAFTRAKGRQAPEASQRPPQPVRQRP
jgi:MarR family transcriptional regulator, organic hydroperoxide resistance regulator